MKNIILALALASGIFANAQLIPQPVDTLAIVKKLEENKSKYIGKPFSVMLNDLGKIQPKLVMPSVPYYYDPSKSGASNFIYKDRPYIYSRDAIRIIVDWDPMISTDEVWALDKKYDSQFTPEMKAFYSDKIVKDFGVFGKKWRELPGFPQKVIPPGETQGEREIIVIPPTPPYSTDPASK